MEPTHLVTNVPVLWMVFAIVMGIIEILTVTFAFVLIGGSAVIAALFASLGFNITVQVLVFAASCVLTLGLIRPRLIKALHSARGVPGRTDTLLGKLGRVTEVVDISAGSGRVTVEGQDWAARSTKSISIGTQVKITGADGIVLIVAPVSE